MDIRKISAAMKALPPSITRMINAVSARMVEMIRRTNTGLRVML